MIRFVILGEPHGKGRPRFSKCGKFSKPRTPEDTILYENLIVTEYERQCGDFKFPKGVPLDLRIMAYYTIPASASKKKQALMRSKAIRPTKKPDWDNIGKVVADALNTRAYHDDAQVVDSMIRKFYSDNPRVEVFIEEAKTYE